MFARLEIADGDFATIKLPDGRQLDVFASGSVQVYTADGAHGMEVHLPSGMPNDRDVALLAIG